MTQAEWDALHMTQEDVEKKIRHLPNALDHHIDNNPEDEVIGHGVGTESSGYMKGSFGIFTFFRKPNGREYYCFAKPPS